MEKKKITYLAEHAVSNRHANVHEDIKKHSYCHLFDHLGATLLVAIEISQYALLDHT